MNMIIVEITFYQAYIGIFLLEVKHHSVKLGLNVFFQKLSSPPRAEDNVVLVLINRMT